MLSFSTWFGLVREVLSARWSALRMFVSYLVFSKLEITKNGGGVVKVADTEKSMRVVDVRTKVGDGLFFE